MLKRRDIRETAIQFLYLNDLQSGSDACSIEDTFWDMTQEDSLKKLNLARAKAMTHVAQARNTKLAKLMEQAPAILAQLKAIPDASPLLSSLKKAISEQKLLSGTLDDLKTSIKSKGNDEVSKDAINAVIEANKTITGSHQNWSDTLANFPQLKNNLESVTASISHLSKVSERLTAIEDPDSAITDFAHLRASNSEIAIARQSVKDLAENVLKHQGEIDSLLADTIENYQPDRVDLVDRAILRLAVYEMKHCEDIPRSVSINEAIEIAKRFSTTESSRFINGVLDAVK